MNSVNSSGEQFSLDDLYSLAADGPELASHTLHHVSSSSTSFRAFLTVVREGRKALQQIPKLASSNNFAYRCGAVTLSTKREVGKEMHNCRGIYPGLNGSVVDVSLLKANPLYGDRELVEDVYRMVHSAAELGGWLSFYTHDVRCSPSAYGCTPALLESAKKIARAALKIMTVDEVLANASCEQQTQPTTA